MEYGPMVVYIYMYDVGMKSDEFDKEDARDDAPSCAHP